jgi:hypothetical protein
MVLLEASTFLDCAVAIVETATNNAIAIVLKFFIFF